MLPGDLTGAEYAALIVAITGALGAIFAGVRNLKGDKFKREVEQSASLLTGYTGMVERLQAEITRMGEEHSAERKEWQEERAAMKAEFTAEMAERDERIDELGSQIYALQHRDNTRERSGD